MKIEQILVQPHNTTRMPVAVQTANGVENVSGGGKMSFKTALAIASSDSTNLRNKISGAFGDYIKTWNSTESSFEKRLNKLNPDNKNLIEMQIDINNFNLKTLFLTQCAEACSSTVKRVQQMGNS